MTPHDETPMLEVAQAVVEAGGEALLECLGCGTCSAVCPWGLVRPTSIRHLLRQAALGLEGFEPESWRCLTCRACVDRCPQRIDLTAVMRAVRGVAAEAGGVPAGLSAAVGSLAAAGNPWGGEPAARGAWAEGLEPARGPAPAEVVFFACCTQAYDPRARRTARAALVLLRRAGLRVGLLDGSETCCGDLARSVGRAELASRLAEANLAALGRAGAAELVTGSPHCRQAFETWYPRAGRLRARHVVEVLAEAVAEGRLALPRSVPRRVAYHDPCYLGRHAGVYEPPRDLLRAVPGLALVELGRSREDSLCCGGGGGGAFRETAREERLALLRVDEAVRAGVDALATACPYCMLMLEDAVRVGGLEGRLEVVDLGELLLEASGSDGGPP